MTEISFENREGTLTLSMTGHAGSAPAGEDLVCAAASMLGYTAMQYASVLEQAGWLLEKPQVTEAPGTLKISFRADAQHLPMAMNAMYVVELGCAVLAHNYPENVTLRRTLAVSAKA